ncbi:hypothetical protein QO058_01535 [Bosea vestrisii]|uniref:hypothetical protein n=1 Tax=Bosea vestrisii TaxID=151416 RepID=UPI0024E00992|nr:hypothetical protein [Bosea vestrisii]WID96994.1 hypothetical protein QO058_01535 [Bosea vestrisii]
MSAVANAHRRSASDERIEFITLNRKLWLSELPKDFHATSMYAGYDKDKKPQNLKLLAQIGRTRPVGNDDVENLVSFEDAMAELDKHPDLILGLAVAMRAEFGFVALDLDDPEKEYQRRLALGKEPEPELQAKRDKQLKCNLLIVKTFREAGALVMLSQSGRGAHIFFRITLPDCKYLHNGKFAFCGQLIAHSGYVYITGEQYPTRRFGAEDTLPDLTETFTEIFEGLKASGDFAQSKSAAGTDESGAKFEVGSSTDYGRQLDLSDDEVIAQAKLRDKSEHDCYAILAGGKLVPTPRGTPSASMALTHAISILDRISGNPAQIERIVMASAIARHPPPPGSRESRAQKCLRLLPGILRSKRAGYDAYRAAKAAEARALDQAVDLSGWDSRPLPDAVPADDRCAGLGPEAAAALRLLEAMQAGGAVEVEEGEDAPQQLQGGARLREIRRRLLACVSSSSPESSPWMSRLVDANCEAMKLPFRKFALLSTIAFMGGLLGRKYKTECGLSAAQSFVLVAPSGTGKGLALGYWPKKFRAARNPRRMRKGHVINGSISSPEALHGDVQHTGTTIHYRADAGSDLKAIAKPMSTKAEELRDRIYEFYDASGLGEPAMFPPSSISGRKRGDRPIKAAQFCAIWSTTPTIFTSVYSSEFLASGGGQRFLISFHDAHGGDPIPDDEVETRLPDDIRKWLSRLLDDINDLDTAYFKASNAEYPTDDASAPDFDEAEREAKRAAALTVSVKYDVAAKAAAWRLDQAVAALMREVNGKRLPAHYAMFGRVVMSAKRLALISAVLRDRERPLIGEADIAWGLAFALDCFVSLAASFDRGDSGDATDGTRESAISEWFERSKKSREIKHGKRVIQDGWVPFWWLKDRAQNNNAFKERNKGSDELLLKALEMMVRGGQLEKSAGEKGALKFKMVGE